MLSRTRDKWMYRHKGLKQVEEADFRMVTNYKEKSGKTNWWPPRAAGKKRG